MACIPISQVRVSLVVYLSVCCLFACTKADNEETKPWFGLALPPGLGNPHAPVVDVSSAQPAPVTVPDDETNFSELQGERIQAYVREIVNIAVQDRDNGSKVWGRVTGFPSGKAAIDWSAEQFRAAGLQDVAIQTFPSSGEMWWATDWQVTLNGSNLFGNGSEDIILETALPTSESMIDGTIKANVVNVGPITEPIPNTDITGKIAVQIVKPERSAYSERTPTRERAQQLMAQGALAVINVVIQTGNMHVRDFSNCNGPCFNLGTQDGEFLLAAINAAEAAGMLDELTMELSLQAKVRSDLNGHNVIGYLPGRGSEENMIINAHVDGWFDAAGDNADGLAVLVAMAKHFAMPEHQLERGLVFVASGGHHSRGLNGPSNVVSMNPKLLSKSVMMLNLEHIAQFTINPSNWTIENTEQSMSFGVSNDSPVLIDIAREGMARYGFNLNPEFRNAVPGDPGGYRPLGIARVEAIHSGPMYHTSGDVFETISVPGLERAARFFTFFVSQTDKYTWEEIGRESTD